jgi:hypothetical protein
MTAEMILQILQWAIGAAFACIGAGFIILFNLVQRVARIEALVEAFGVNAAKVLHSPHTPELDKLLEKYIDRNYELSVEEWEQLHAMCDRIVHDTKLPKQERMLAGFVAALAKHKLMRPNFGKPIVVGKS